MKFRGYKYKFNLNASHSIKIYDQPTASHTHTFEITLFIEALKEELILYDEIENLIEDFLRLYDQKELGETEPFNQISPTLENMGDVFFNKIKTLLKPFGFKLVKLEISDSPSSVYIVKDDKNEMNQAVFNQMLIKSMVNAATDEMIGEYLNLQPTKLEEGSPLSIEKLIDKIDLSSQQDDLKKEFLGEREKEMVVYPTTVIKEDINIKENKNTRGKFLKIVGAVFFLIMLSGFLLVYINQLEGGPWGADIYGHIFKADLVYRSLSEGKIYPLFTELWYNGIQPFRYWGPFPYYILAGCQALGGGSTETGYLIFIGVTFLTGGLGWLLWGIRENRIFLGMFCGILWFFIPDNARVFFSEGNVPRIVITMLIPYLFFFIWEFVEHENRKSILGVVIVMVLSIISHLMIAAMIGIASFIFLSCYTMVHKEVRRAFQIITVMLFTFAVCGIWVYPALFGGLVSMDSEATSEVMKSLSIPFNISLNPFLRLESTGYFYYGLSVVAIAIIGTCLSYKKSVPGFITTLIIFLGTTTAFVPLLIKLPLNQLLWMMRFTPMAYGFFLIGLLEWKTCRKSILGGMLFVILLDSSLSFNIPLYTAEKPVKITKALDLAKNITRQRMLLLDNSLFGSYPSYYFTAEGRPVPYAYGWAWQGAATAQNIVLLNTAVEKGYYVYMFDRAVEMGCDTMIIRKASLEKTKNEWQDMREAARLSGYELYEETEESYITYRKTGGDFGVVTRYEGLCIGRGAVEIPLQYPYFEIGKSWNIEDYSLEELSEYKIIYLSDFKYNNRLKAEKLLTDVSQRGVRIYVDMNKIPVDLGTNRMIFLGISAQPITFYDEFGELFFNKKIYKSKPFRREYENWNTVYLEHLKEETGFLWMENEKLAFIGKGEYENITFLGFNLMFHSMLNEDHEIQKLLGEVMGIEPTWIPERELVKLQIKEDKEGLRIYSPVGNVNTTFAFLDAYKSNKPIFEKHHLLHVQEGETRIKITYPYLFEGIIVSLVGITTLIGWVKLLERLDRKRDG